MTPNQINLQNYLIELRECAIGPWEPISKTASVSDGLANRLARVMTYRNERPREAREHLVAAFAAWPILCRAMAELEASYPEEAGKANQQSRQVLDMLDRRDGRGDYA